MDKEKLYVAATKEFASNGLKNASIDNILADAHISEEEFKKEFQSKEQFFMEVVNYGVTYLENVFDSIMNTDLPTIVKLEKVLREAIRFSKEYPDLVNLYNEITTEASNPFLAELSKKVESISINSYKKIIEQAKEKGEVPHNEDTSFLSFCLDNLFVITQFSYIPGYFQERMKVYLGDKYLNDEEAFIEEMMFLISRMFGPDFDERY